MSHNQRNCNIKKNNGESYKQISFVRNELLKMIVSKEMDDALY